MKRTSALIALIILLVSGCTVNLGTFSASRLPSERSATTGVLVLATDVTNRTTERFAYYYAFVSDMRPEFQINVRLLESRKVAVIDNILPGQYSLTGIKVVSEPNSKIKTFVAPDIRQLKHPVSFAIRPGAITILDYGLVAALVYSNGYRQEELTQNMQLKKLGAGDRGLVLQELARRGNLNAWSVADEIDTAPLPEVAYSDSSRAYVRSYLRRFDD